MALTLLCFAAAERYPERRRLFLALMYVSVGLGMLTKGPVAAVVPGLVFAAYLLVHRELRRVTEMMIPAGRRDRPGDRRAVVRRALRPRRLDLHRVLLRRREPRSVRVRSRRPGAARTFFYLPVLFSDSFPWSLLLDPGVHRLAERAQRRRRPRVTPAAGCGRCCGCGSRCSSGSSRFRRGSRTSTSSRSCLPYAASPAGPSPAPATRARPAVDARARPPASRALLLVGRRSLVYLFEVGGRGVRDRRRCRDRRHRSRWPAGWRCGSGCVSASAAACVAVACRLRRRCQFDVRGRDAPELRSLQAGPGFADTIRQRAAPDDIVATYDAIDAEPRLLPAAARRGAVRCRRAGRPPEEREAGVRGDV